MPTAITTDHGLRILSLLLPVVVIALVTILVLGLLVLISLRIAYLFNLLKQEWVFIELTPSSQANKSPEATQQLFAVLHGQHEARTLRQKLLRRKATFSLEVVSTKDGGIRYIIRVTKADAPIFERTIASYLPEVKFRQIRDYFPEALGSKTVRVLEFKQTGHFAYPLRSQLLLSEHDPIAYLTGTMTRLHEGELVALQLVVSPTKVREAETIAARMLGNEELLHTLGKRHVPVVANLFSAINTVLFGVADSVGELAHGPTLGSQKSRSGALQRKQDVEMKIKPARTLGAFEQELAQTVHEKLRQPMFAVNVRVMMVMRTKQAADERTRGVRSAVAALSVAPYQALKARYGFPKAIMSKYRLFAFAKRMPSVASRSAALFDASELANIYHFPSVEAVTTENVVQSLSRTLPAPISLKGSAKLDIILGRNHHHGTSTDIGLTAEERQRHVYVIGGTGNGKTTMLEYAIVQDIKNGKGVAVVDPHGDLAEKLLGYIPQERIKDVIYFNPADLGYPVGLNLLEIPEGLVGDELLEAKDFITEAVISIMRKVFSADDSGGHRIEYVLRNTVQTALTLPDATLFTVFDLLTDMKYCKQIVRTLKDQKLKNFWKNEFGKAGDFQRVKMSAGVTAKIGRFQFSAAAERILSQPKSTINFEEILDGKILICNFAKGLIGEDTSELFGIATLAKLQLAAYRRVKQQRENRKPFYLYVDEFQNFATMSFVQMLSEARKYQVFLTMAEQSTSQQEEQRMVYTILANVGTVICFRSGNPADEELLLPLFSPYIQEGEIANLPTYNFYARISAVLSQEPVSGATLLLEAEGSRELAQLVITSSREYYARKYLAKDNADSIEKLIGATKEQVAARVQ